VFEALAESLSGFCGGTGRAGIVSDTGAETAVRPNGWGATAVVAGLVEVTLLVVFGFAARSADPGTGMFGMGKAAGARPVIWTVAVCADDGVTSGVLDSAGVSAGANAKAVSEEPLDWGNGPVPTFEFGEASSEIRWLFFGAAAIGSGACVMGFGSENGFETVESRDPD